MKKRVLKEQQEAADFLAANPDHPQRQMAVLGASDWLAEEVLTPDPYTAFLESKAPIAVDRGVSGEIEMKADLKPHARDAARWMIRGGNRACFASFGLHKTSIQLQVMESLLDVHTEGIGLIVCPLGVRREFIKESRARGFARVPIYVSSNADLDDLRAMGHTLFITNYERVRDGGLDPKRFQIVTLDEASVLRSFGSKTYQEFLPLFESVPYKFVATATPSPNRLKELIHYAGFLGIMDTGQCLTRFFKRDPTKAGNLTIHPHKAAATEKRDSMADRIMRARQIIESAGPDRHWIIWHDLEDERRAIQATIPGAVCIWGTQDLEDRERTVEQFADGELKILGTKPILSGSGSNLQEHCYSNIFLGIGYKFNDFLQSLHRTQRFGQTHDVEAHLIYTESEDPIHDELMRKWKQHDELHATMAKLIREYGLNSALAGAQMRRAIVTYNTREESELFTAVNTDNVLELRSRDDNSIDLIVTSWPFSDHYEYTEAYQDFGHNDGDKGFFEQMEFLTPEIMRCLKPGRMYCVHAKDRIVYGSVSGLGMYSVNRFSDKCADHLEKHGFICCGRITVVTDVVRENNQTYRLGWTENSKDGTKMGVGSPEYVLIFRKLPTDRSNSYADEPVVKSKEDYSRAHWQFDAHSFWRSSGDRFITPEEASGMPMDMLRKAWLNYSRRRVYDFGEHVTIAHEMEKRGILPSSFMALEVANPGAPYVWDDVVRMRTLNGEQARKGWEQHVCPLQIDVVERLIERYSNPGEIVCDPFGGIGTVAYCAILQGRKAYTIELNSDYHRDALSYCRAAEQKVTTPTLFDFLKEETTT